MTHRVLGLGLSTAYPEQIEHRLSRLAQKGIVAGDWLDLGCHDGTYTDALRRFGAQTVQGCDVVAEAIAKARENFPDIRFLTHDPRRLPFTDESFDGVLMNEVLEHVEDEAAILKEVYRVLRPGGHLALMSPNRGFPFEGHGAILAGRRIHAPVPFLPWLPMRWVGRFMKARNYWPRDLVRLVTEAGMVVTDKDFVFPLLVEYSWLPARLTRRYRRSVNTLEQLPVIRRLGLSTLIIAQR